MARNMMLKHKTYDSPGKKEQKKSTRALTPAYTQGNYQTINVNRGHQMYSEKSKDKNLYRSGSRKSYGGDDISYVESINTNVVDDVIGERSGSKKSNTYSNTAKVMAATQKNFNTIPERPAAGVHTRSKSHIQHDHPLKAPKKGL